MTNYEEIIERIEDIIEDGKPSVMGGGSKVKVDADLIRQALSDLSSSIPQEIIQARRIVAERREILEGAKDSANKMIEDAKARALQLIEDHEITRQARAGAAQIENEARAQATDIVTEANTQAEGIRTDADAKAAATRASAEKWANDLKANTAQFVSDLVDSTIKHLQGDLKNTTDSLNTLTVVRKRLSPIINKHLSSAAADEFDAG